MIYYVKTIWSREVDDFDTRLNEVIDTAQNDGLMVEVQFSADAAGLNALVIAKRKPVDA